MANIDVDNFVSVFVDTYSLDLSVVLLQVLAAPEQGGLGYRIETFNPVTSLDGWDIDRTNKIIKIEETGLISRYTDLERAEFLRNAIETEFSKTRTSMWARLGWGTGKVVLGVVEGALGLIGIIAPAPGTSVAGVIVLTLAANNIMDGVSQLAGANQGNGINLLSEGFGSVGAGLADLANVNPEAGRKIGKGVFFVGSIAAGSLASIKILYAPGRAVLQFGVGGQPGGVQLGRLQALYASNRAQDGMTILNITDNSGKWFLRFVTHGGRLMLNGRILGVSKVFFHETNPRVILKGLLKLLAHGWKF